MREEVTPMREKERSTVREMTEVIKKNYKIWAIVRFQKEMREVIKKIYNIWATVGSHFSKIVNFLGYSMFDGAIFCGFRC